MGRFEREPFEQPGQQRYPGKLGAGTRLAALQHLAKLRGRRLGWFPRRRRWRGQRWTPMTQSPGTHESETWMQTTTRTTDHRGHSERSHMTMRLFIHRRQALCLGLIATVATSVALRAQTPQLQPGQKLDPLSLQWPRFFATNGYEFAVFQPQIAKWPGNQLEGRFAVAVRSAGTTNETLGVISFKARTDIDKVNRLVTLEDFKITKVVYPTQRAMQPIYQTIIQGELPRAAKTIPLDHLEATYAVSAEVAKLKIQKIENTPPHFI